MKQAKLYNQSGEQTGSVELNPKIFEVPVKESLVHQAMVAQLANARLVIADTKDKGEVRGGGRKPWRQKGTGRARHGSIRSPLWKGGGVTFGPTTDRNFSKAINKKMKRKALFMVLSDKANNDLILAIDSLDAQKKTKSAKDLLKAIKLDNSLLIVIEKMDQGIVRAFRNIPRVTVISANSLNVLDALKHKNILITEKALKEAENTFLKKA